MNKVKYFETNDGKQLKTAQFDGYDINDRTFEGLMFQVDVNEDGTLKVYVKSEDEDFFSDFNEAKWLAIATDYAYKCDSYSDPKTGEECWLTFEGQENNSTNTTATPIAVSTVTPVSVSSGIPAMKTSIQDIANKLGLGNVTYTDEGISIVDKEETETEVEVKEPVIGEFKPKRKFLSFVSAVAGKKIRLLRETAFIEGRKLSGVLERAKFKITICDEGTINFEEVEGTNLADTAMKQRLINEIDSTDVTGYAQKFIVAGLEFEDQDGYRCFLEVDYVKPYDKLMALFAEETNKVEEEPAELSEKGLNFLDMLLSEDETEVETEPVVEPVKEETYLEKQFRLMNEGKVNELKERIEKTELEIKRYATEAKHAEANAEKSTEALALLETRLEALVPNATSNGYAFLVSDEQTSDITLDANSEQLVDKISTLLKIKKDKLVKYLTEGHYKISIANKANFEDKKVTKEIYQLIQSVDLLGKFTVVGDGEFEYRGKLNWHQLTAKMLKKGFEQDPEFDKVAGSNSYEVKTEREIISDNGGFVLIAEKGMPFSNNVGTQREVTKKVENPTFVQKTLQTFTKPETIVLLGDGTNDCDSYDFQVTDDESGFDIYVDGKEKHYSSCTGFGSVLTLSQYKQWLKDTEDEGYRDITDAYIIPGFVGTIGISAKLDDGSFSTDFDMEDYIQHQFDDSYAEVIINFPEGTELYQIKDHDLSTVTDVLRDDKIKTVLATDTTDEVEESTNLTVFTGNKGGWLKNSDTNKHIFDKLNFVGNMYEPKKGDTGEKICDTTTSSGKTYVRVRFPEGECVINQDKLR